MYSKANYVVQICYKITCGRVFNGKIYAQRLQKLIYLHLSTDCFISLHQRESRSRQLK